ncbi:MAG: hypothetical protein SGJ19_16430 [Planctomycetia bacterium]|nr:hypothetical protein [Planctomycetia bacterium]
MNAPQLTAALFLALCAAASRAEPPITALAFAPNENILVVGSQQGLALRAWPSLELAGALPTELANVHDVAFSPDGAMLAVAGGAPSECGELELLDWSTRLRIGRAVLGEDVLYSARWRPDGGGLLVAGGNGYAAIINADTLSPRCELSGHTRAVLSAAWLSQDTALTAGVDNTILLWNTVTGATQRSLNQHTDAVQAIIVRPPSDGKQSLVATIGADRTVRFWQPNIGRMVRLARLDSRPTAAVWSANGEVIHIACWDGRVRSVRAGDAELLREAKAIDGVAYAIAMAPDGAVIVGGRAGQLTRLQVP